MKFNPCIGKCTHTGTHCEGCGRSHDEVRSTHQFIENLANYAKNMEYENPQDFINFVANGINYKLQQL
jgi:hypothetical protein